MDQPRLNRVDLPPKVGDVGLDDAVVAPKVVLPDVVEDLRLRQHPAGVVHEVAQQLELGGRQRHESAGATHLVALLVEFEVGEGELGRGGLLAGRTAKDRPDPSGQLLKAERLGHIVVAAERQAPDLVVGGVAGGQEDDGRAHTAVAHAPDHLEAVEVRQHDVEDHEVGPGVRGHSPRHLRRWWPL